LFRRGSRRAAEPRDTTSGCRVARTSVRARTKNEDIATVGALATRGDTGERGTATTIEMNPECPVQPIVFDNLLLPVHGQV
jgi:hypothetical protein